MAGLAGAGLMVWAGAWFSVRGLRVYLPASAMEIRAQGSIEGAVKVVPRSTVGELTPILVGAEGAEGADGVDGSSMETFASRRGERVSHDPAEIARGLLCGGRRSHLARHWDEIWLTGALSMIYLPSEWHAIFLNGAYFGDGQFGIEAASEHYFGEPASKLSLARGALLLGLMRQPAYLSPARYPERALTRRNAVLEQMRRQGSVNAEAALAAEHEGFALSQ